MNLTESEDDLNNQKCSSQWNPSVLLDDDEITVTAWKDKDIVGEAEKTGKTVIKSKYLTAVPVDLLSRKTAEVQNEVPVKREKIVLEDTDFIPFLDDDGDVYVPPEEDPDAVDMTVSAPEETEPEIAEEDLDYNDVFQNDPEVLRRRKKKRKVTGIIGNILKEAVILILIFVLSVFLVASFNVLFRRQNEVFGTSMEPSYIEGDTVYSSYFTYLTGEPEIGDVVIFDYSAFESQKKPTFFRMLSDVLKNNKLTQYIAGKDIHQDTYWIKRVVGVGGDTIEFRDGQFFRNGEPIYEDYIKDQKVTNYPSGGTTIVVPDGYVFLMGDNRNVSHDSRAIGCIPLKYIIGKCK